MRAVYLKDKNGNKLVSVPYYRVGDLFLTTIATNPSSYLGGTWELFGPGRCLVCVDTSQSEFNSVKKTGGEKTHTLNTNEIPAHSHGIETWYGADQWALGYIWSRAAGSGSSNKRGGQAPSTYNTGGGQPHNNLQPFITCYVWIRTA